MTGLLSCPAEINVRILFHCHGFPDIVAFVTTCRQLYSLWKNSAPAIIGTVAQRHILAFDDALMAVRATNLVTPALAAGQIPPDIGSIAELSATSRSPTISELAQVMSMQHLVRCLEHMFFFSGVQNHMSQWTALLQARPPNLIVREGQGDDQAAHAHAMLKWKESFRRATYRLFLAGAAFARAYNEPLFRLSESIHDSLAEPSTGESVQRDRELLRKISTAYDFEPDDEKEAAIFEPLSSWIVEQARDEASRRAFVSFWKRPAFLAEMPEEEQEEDDEDEAAEPMDDADVFAVWEMMRMLAAYELTRVRFTRRTEPPSEEMAWLATLQSDQIRKVSVVMFGDFQLDEVIMPARLEDAENILLIADRVTPLDNQKSPEGCGGGLPQPQPDSRAISERLWRVPVPLGHSSRFPGPTLQYKFFTYTLRVRWNRRFTDLDAEWANSPYQEFIALAQAFSEGDHGEENYGLEFVEPC